MLSAICFNLDQSEILSSGNGLKEAFLGGVFHINQTTCQNLGIHHYFIIISGLFLGISVMKNINIKDWEKTVGWITLAIYLLFVAFAIFFNGLYDGYPETDWSPCCP